MPSCKTFWTPLVQMQTNIIQKVALINSKNTLENYAKTEPGLVAFYDIRPGNGARLFLQPRSLHGVWVFQRTCGDHQCKFFRKPDALPVIQSCKKRTPKEWRLRQTVSSAVNQNPAKCGHRTTKLTRWLGPQLRRGRRRRWRSILNHRGQSAVDSQRNRLIPAFDDQSVGCNLAFIR